MPLLLAEGLFPVYLCHKSKQKSLSYNILQNEHGPPSLSLAPGGSTWLLASLSLCFFFAMVSKRGVNMIIGQVFFYYWELHLGAPAPTQGPNLEDIKDFWY